MNLIFGYIILYFLRFFFLKKEKFEKKEVILQLD